MKVSNKILIVENDPDLRDSLKNSLEFSGYSVVYNESPKAIFEDINTYKPSIVLIDYYHPDINSVKVIKEIVGKFREIEIIVTITYPDTMLSNELISMGVHDIIAKPFQAYQVRMSVKKVMEKQRLLVESKDFQRLLEKKIKEQTLSLRLRNQEKQQLLINTIKSLVQTLEAKDSYTEGHSHRVAENSLQIAHALGMSLREQEEVKLAGLLHDIGKIGIHESVLNKRGRLTDDEYAHIKSHPLVSQRILEPIPQFKAVVSIIRHHHEFFDGSGYPDRLAGKKIPTGARILTICDAHDAMTSDRPYRSSLTEGMAYDIMDRNAGIQFDPDLLRIFYKIKGRAITA